MNNEWFQQIKKILKLKELFTKPTTRTGEKGDSPLRLTGRHIFQIILKIINQNGKDALSVPRRISGRIRRTGANPVIHRCA
jgi:hypothetical protein